jgi:hypothetical protein
MINARYRKLTGLHKGHTYVVLAPASEIDNPLRWELKAEADEDDRPIVSETELNDPALWQPLD